MLDLSQNGLNETNQEVQNLIRNINDNVTGISGKIDNILDSGGSFLSNIQNQILSMLNTLNQSTYLS